MDLVLILKHPKCSGQAWKHCLCLILVQREASNRNILEAKQSLFQPVFWDRLLDNMQLVWVGLWCNLGLNLVLQCDDRIRLYKCHAANNWDLVFMLLKTLRLRVLLSFIPEWENKTWILSGLGLGTNSDLAVLSQTTERREFAPDLLLDIWQPSPYFQSLLIWKSNHVRCSKSTLVKTNAKGSA